MNLKIDTDNQAFEEDKSFEVVRILKEVIQKLESGYQESRLFDLNGNAVGEFSL